MTAFGKAQEKRKGKTAAKPGIGRKLLYGAGHLVMGGVKGTVGTAAAAVEGAARHGAEKTHEKLHAAISQAEQDNTALETAHKAEQAAEWAFRKGKRGIRDNLKKNSARKKAKKLNGQPADLKGRRRSILEDAEKPVQDGAADKAAPGKSKFHTGDPPPKAKASRFKMGEKETSAFRKMMGTPVAKIGQTVDFGPKQPGLLSRGLHKGMDTGKHALRFGGEKAVMRFRGKIDQYGEDNSSIKAAHEVEQLAERPARYVLKKGTNLVVKPVKTVSNKIRNAVRHKFLVYKQRFLAKHQGVAKARGVVMKLKAIFRELLIKSTPVLKAFGIGLLLYALFVIVIGPIVSALTTAGAEYIATTTYPVASQDITGSTAQWKELEMGLEQRIDNIESEFPNYNEYRYDIDPMEHDPFELMSYLAAMHLEFTHPQVQAEIAALFQEVNTLQLVEEIETRYDSDGDPYEWRILNVILKPKPFEEVVAPKLEAADAKDLYEVYMGSGGNQQAFGNPFTFNWTNSITSYYGYRQNPTGPGYDFHTGLDIAAPEGIPIRSVQNGTVVVAGWHDLYGNYAVIRNEAGITTLYAHCLSLGVEVGDEVRQGQIIAAVGSTGNSSGNHLHIELKIGDERINPLFYIQAYDE